VDDTGLYFELPDGDKWDIPKDSTYVHYTSADTRQGLEFQNFAYDAIPEGTELVCDASANLGSKPVDISKVLTYILIHVYPYTLTVTLTLTVTVTVTLTVTLHEYSMV